MRIPYEAAYAALLHRLLGAYQLLLRFEDECART
jgi:hypothetical protein